MTLDQKIQIWVAVGTWVAGLATLAAVIVALRLAKKVEKVKLKVRVGLRELFMGDGSPAQKHLAISVTNLGERAVTINSVGWAVGKGKHREFAMQPEAAVYSAHYPIRANLRQRSELHGFVSRHSDLAERLRHWFRPRPFGQTFEIVGGADTYFCRPDGRSQTRKRFVGSFEEIPLIFNLSNCFRTPLQPGPSHSPVTR